MSARRALSSIALGWLTARPIAHRGLHDQSLGIVENSPSAFAAAIGHGFAIECDLQISSDGEAMVFHDEALERLTGKQGRVAAMTARTLGAIPLKGSEDRIPTLCALLDQVQGRTPLVIELKSLWNGDVRIAARAVELLQSYGGPFALMSFDPDLIEEVRQRMPSMARGIVADRVSDGSRLALPLPRRLELRHMTHMGRTQPQFLAFDVDGLPSPASRLFHEAGLPVICWTVRDEATRARALNWCDQITFEGFLPDVCG